MVMMGLGGTATITPASSGTVWVGFYGLLTNTGTGGMLTNIQYGTGTAPSNGAASTGTTIGNTAGPIPSVSGALTNFAVYGIVTGLSAGTTYWLDLQLRSVSGGTSSLQAVTCAAFEIK